MARRRGRTGFTWDYYGDEIAEAVRKGGEPALWRAGQMVKAEAERRAPVRTGELRRSMYVETVKRTDYRQGRRDRRWGRLKVASADTVLIASGAWYGNLLEDSGAAAHQIPYKGRTTRRDGSRRKVLRIPGVGYRRVGNHPGMRRKPFLLPALQAVEGRLVDAMCDTLAAEIVRAAPNA